MKAAIVMEAGTTPVYGEFQEPVVEAGKDVITVSAAALSHFTKSRASGAHYSSEHAFPAVPGSDGVGYTADGRRMYFALPEAPFGALGEKALVDVRRCVPIPDELDDVTAAALANPGMSAWTALVERAKLQRGDTVLVNGATSTAGRLTVQLAKYLGAGKVIATGRNAAELWKTAADVMVPFALGDAEGVDNFEQALTAEFAHGIDVVIDFLWGESARTIILAVAKAVEDARPVRFVHVGEASGEDSIALPGAALRSSAIQLMGSGVKSVPMKVLLESIRNVFEVAGEAGLTIATTVVPLAEVELAWTMLGKPRVVVKVS